MEKFLQEKWLETGIDNDFMFHCVMSKHPELCLKLLQMIFPELGITNVTITETQKEYEESPNVHGVRLDVYSEDSDNRAYDIEMQAMNRGNLRKRSRYNQSMMDRQQLIKSMDYSELKDSFVIFICNFDLFGQNRYVYVFENRCKDEPNLKLEDGMTKVFINAKGTVGDITPELNKFLKMVSKHEATDDFTRKLQEIIDFFHMDDNTRDSYMTLEMKILEETKYASKIALEEGLERGRKQGLEQGLEQGRKQGLEQGREQGLEKGRKQGLEQGKLLEIISCVKDGLFSEEVGAKRAGLSLEEFKKHLENN